MRIANTLIVLFLLAVAGIALQIFLSTRPSR